MQTGDEEVMKAQGLSLGGAPCLVLHPELSAPILSSWHSRFCATSVSFSQPIFIYVLRSSINTYLLVHISLFILPLPSLPPSCPPVCTTVLDDMLRDIFPNRWAHKQGVRKVMEEQQLPSHRVSIHIRRNGLHHAHIIIG